MWVTRWGEEVGVRGLGEWWVDGSGVKFNRQNSVALLKLSIAPELMIINATQPIPRTPVNRLLFNGRGGGGGDKGQCER